MSSLSTQHCEPCESGIGQLTQAAINTHLTTLKGWAQASDGIEKKWKFNNYLQAQALVMAVGEVAEAQGHHPDITFGWGYATIRITTHAAQGLTLNDFILAAKIDDLPQAQ